MPTDCIYSSIEKSKTDIELPIFTDGKSMNSKYNPQREAETIFNQLDKKYSFFIVTGFGCGIIIQQLLNNFPECKILIIENSDREYDFLKKLCLFKELNQHKDRLIFSTIPTLKKDLVENYIPALYGDIKIIENQIWLSKVDSSAIKENINSALKIISQDFSVQSHFGKLWQNNIMKNLLLLNNKINPALNSAQTSDFNISLSKKALVVAAGPSIDNTILKIKENNDYFIIATDTAFSILQKNNIKPQIVVSIDGQNVSYNHYLSNNKNIYKDTLFLFDLCSNPHTVNYLINKNAYISFFNGGHPLSYFACEKLPVLYSGSGTVTICALDLAVKLGFKNIEVIGADFGYRNGKSYAKGTYFEEIYSKNSSRIQNIETNYDKLLFRQPFIKRNNNDTTELLDSYRLSFEDYINKMKIKMNYSNDIYFLENNFDKTITINELFTDFNYIEFINNLKNEKSMELKNALLPYVAYLRFHEANYSLEEYLDKAYKAITRYVK